MKNVGNNHLVVIRDSNKTNKTGHEKYKNIVTSAWEVPFHPSKRQQMLLLHLLLAAANEADITW